MKLNNDWTAVLNEELKKDYFKDLQVFLTKAYSNSIIYPEKSLIFNSLNLLPFNKVKVVILGQDPYHEPNQAHGLAFSTLENCKTPPSLKNIFQEIKNDLQVEPDKSPNLTRWEKQGVLLLNTVLTVEKGKANSHKNQGWEKLTSEVISKISAKKEPVVFMLWGNQACAFATTIKKHHLVLTSSHPSPLSVYRGFNGCKHFSKCNEFLKKTNQKQIDWR